MLRLVINIVEDLIWVVILKRQEKCHWDIFECVYFQTVARTFPLHLLCEVFVSADWTPPASGLELFSYEKFFVKRWSVHTELISDHLNGKTTRQVEGCADLSRILLAGIWNPLLNPSLLWQVPLSNLYWL